MKIHVYFTPLGLAPGDLNGRGVIVIDVLRATTTIVTALANGAKAVVPTPTAEEAVRLTAHLEKNDYVLAGERRVLRIEGFGLGNSPREMTREAVGGKTVFLATTNGTPALVAAQGGDPILVGSVANFSATVACARALFHQRGDLVIVCSGREKQFALEDAYTAGRIAKAVKRGTRGVKFNDGGRVAVDLVAKYRSWTDALQASEAAALLREADLAEDVIFCARADRYDVLPTYADRRIT